MIGFIGCGNMANAMINGMLKNNIKSNDIWVFDTNKSKLEIMSEKGINVCSSNEIFQKSKYVFLAIKPNVYNDVLNDVKDVIKNDSVIISMAAGFKIDSIKQIIGNKKVVRIMPNTPALVGEGFTAVCFDNLIDEKEKNTVMSLLKSFSYVVETKENYINAYSAISGSGPAFAFMFIEAMADAAVLLGIPREDAYKAAQQTLLGSSKLSMLSQKHPGELKDMVCSPGGTTIEGVRTLEEKGFRSAVIECIVNTYKKNLDISNIR